MRPAGQSSDELVDFINVLHLNGYHIDTEQYIAAQRLLIALAAKSSDFFTQPHRLSNLLAPVFCISREQQEVFPHLFEQWLKTRPRLFVGQTSIEIEESSKTISSTQNEKTEKPLPSTRIKWWVWLIALGLVIAAIVLIPRLKPVPSQALTLRLKVIDNRPGGMFFMRAEPEHVEIGRDGGDFLIRYRSDDLPIRLYLTDKTNWTMEVPITDAVDSMTVTLNGDSPPEIPEPSGPSFGRKLLSFYRENFILSVGLLAGAIFLCAVLVWLRRLSRRLELKKWRSENRPRLDQLPVEGISEQIWCLFPLRRTAQELRRYRQYSAHDLDVQRTTEETIRQGLFTPTYAPRKSLSEYLVLIDRTNFEDHQARLVSDLMERLSKNDVFIERYYFQGDPRVCRKHDPKAPYQTLPNLAAQFPDHYLMVFSDAEDFFSPVTGHPAHWLKMFSPWETRILLTPEYQPGDYREWVLSAAGFRVLPTSQAGMAALSETIYAGPKQDHVGGAVKTLPGILRTGVARWLEDHPPAPATTEELCSQLKNFLGDEGYFWLGACAVYPSLQWDLTLYLGFKLLKQDSLIEKFSTLMRLPWFRHGSMPDWFRERLILGLSPNQEQSIRNVLEKLLLSALMRPEGFNLLVALEPPAADASFLKRAWRRLSGAEREKKRFIVENLKSESEDSVLRDYVLLSFMAGRKPNRLALSVPNELHDLLYPRRQLDWDLYFVKALMLTTVIFGSGLLILFAAILNPLEFILSAFVVIAWTVTTVSSIQEESSLPTTSTKLEKWFRRIFDRLAGSPSLQKLLSFRAWLFDRLSGSTSLQKTLTRRTWLIPGLVAVILFVGAVASNLIASNLAEGFYPYRGWAWIVFAIALVVTVVTAIIEARRRGYSSVPSAEDAPDWRAVAENLRIAKPVGSRSVLVADDVKRSTIVTGMENVIDSRIVGDSIARDASIYFSSSVSALHQLRAPVFDFVGREQEISTLINALRRVSRACITGMGGIGKTELALLVAERLSADYPDAQFFINLQGTDAEPRLPQEVMAICIRAFLGSEARLPEDVDQLSQLYRSQLSGKRVLLLLDNAADSAQVRSLLPPPGSALLVTSRQAIVLPGMTTLTLNPLTDKEAQDLLLEITPRSAPVAEQIVALCGYLPLALRAAGSLLAIHADLDPADYAAQLKDERNRLERIGAEGVELGLAASFDLSYARLVPETARVFRMLSVFTGAFDAVAEEAVCSDARHVNLSELVRRSLVLYDSSTKRYRLHDLARLFADSKLGDDERAVGNKRHEIHYKKGLGRP